MNFVPDREDGDGYEEMCEQKFNARKWLRGVADRSQSPMVRDLMGDLRQLELMSAPFFLGLDYDEDFDDVDGSEPFR